MFTNRQCKLINLLLNNPSGMSGRELSVPLGVSSRTIRTDISQINRQCSSFSISILADKVAGYLILPKQRSLFQHLIHKSDSNYTEQFPSTPSERLVYLFFRLLFQQNYLPMEALAEELYTSKTTISHDLKKINLITENEEGITLDVLPLCGATLTGSEYNKRKLLLHLISTYYSINRQALYKTLNLFELNSEQDYLHLYELYVKELNGKNICLTDTALTTLIFNTILIQKRISSGFFVEESYTPIFTTLLFDENIYTFFLPDGYPPQEIWFLNDVICTKPTISLNMSHNQFSAQAKELLSEYADTLRNQYQIDISAYKAGMEQLLYHIASIIGRNNMNELEASDPEPNPQFSYPFAFELATAILPIFKKRLSIQLTAAEISYIAIHIAVILEHIADKKNVLFVCCSNLGTARLTATQIETFFKNQFQIVGCCTVYQMDQFLANTEQRIDYIFSSMPLQLQSKIPQLQVNTLLTPSDIEQLIHILYSSHFDSAPQKSGLSIINLLYSDLFITVDKNFSEHAILKEMTMMLVNKRLISSFSAFYRSVLEREKLYSTLYDRLWIPHPMKSFSNRTTACIAIVNTPNVKRLIFMLAINAREPEHFKYLYSQIVKLINNPFLVTQLLSCRDFSSFIKLMETLSH